MAADQVLHAGLQIAVDDILRKRGGKERLKYLSHVSCPFTFQFLCQGDS